MTDSGHGRGLLDKQIHYSKWKEAYFDTLAESHLLSLCPCRPPLALLDSEPCWHTLYINRPSGDFLKVRALLFSVCSWTLQKALLLKFRWSSFDPNKWLQRLLGEEPCSLWLAGSLLAGAWGSVVSECSCLWLVAPVQSVHEVQVARCGQRPDSCDLLFLGHPQP